MLLRLAPLLFVLLWSSGFIGTKLAVAGAEPFTFLSIRFVLVLSLLVPAGLMLGRGQLTMIQRLHAMMAGALLHSAYLGGITWGASVGMDANVSALICSLQPILTAVLAGAVLGEAITLRHWSGLVLGLIGAALVIVPKLGASGAELAAGTTAGVISGPGLAAVVCALLAITAGTIYQKRYAGLTNLVGGAIWQFAGALAVVAPLSFILETQKVTWSPGFVFALLWLVVVLSLGAIFLLMLLIRENAVSRTSALFYLVPGVTSLMAYFAFGETLGPVQMVGLVIVAIAVILLQQAPPAPADPARQEKVTA